MVMHNKQPWTFLASSLPGPLTLDCSPYGMPSAEPKMKEERNAKPEVQRTVLMRTLHVELSERPRVERKMLQSA